MSDRPPEWREQPDHQDWPDHQEGPESGRRRNGRRHGRGQAPEPAGPDWPGGPAEAGQGWYQDPPQRTDQQWDPGAPGWHGLPNPPEQPGSGRPGRDRPPRPGRRRADQGTSPATGPVWDDAGPEQAGGGRATGQPPVQGWPEPAQPGQTGRQDAGEWPDPEWRGAGPQPTRGRYDPGERPAPGRRVTGERPGAGPGAPPAPGRQGGSGRTGQGWPPPGDQPAPDWGAAAGEAPQEDPGWRDLGGQPQPPGQPGAAPPGAEDSGRVVPDRAQRNSARITGRLTRRTDRGSLFRGRRDAAGHGAPTAPQPPAPAAGEGVLDPAVRPAWPTGQPVGERPWSPQAPGEAPTGEQRRPTPPHAWSREGEAGFAEPVRFAAPAPGVHQRPGHGEAPAGGDWQGYEAPRYGEAPAGTGEFGLAGYGRGPARPEEPAEALQPPAGQEWEDDEEPAEADEADSLQPGGPDGRWVGPPAPAAGGRRSRRGAHGRTRTRALPRLPKAGRARIPQASLALAAIAILVAGGLVGLLNLVPKAAGPVVADAGAPYSARWVCPLLPNTVGTVTANNVGRTAASLDAGSDAQAAGGGPTQQLAARASHVFHAKGGPNGGFVQVEAFGAPVAATSAGQPPCVAGPATRWWLPGLTSSGDTKVTLVIANPETLDATVNITPHLTEGSLHPEALQNVFVRAGTTVLKDINVPEVQTLNYTAEVVASQGRVVVGARLDSKLGNRQEHLIVPAQPAMRSSWAFSGGLGGEARQVELLVTNPNPDPLSLVVEGVNDQGPFKVAGFHLPIGDGAINEALVPVNVGKAAVFGLRVRSQDGSKFVAALRYGAGGGPINTSHLDLGGSGLDARWMAPVVPESRRLVLANTAGEPVTATVSPLGNAAASGTGKGGSLTIQPGRVRYADVPKGVQSLLLLADAPGLVAAPVGPGQLVPGSEVGGVPLEGPITPGPAAAP